MVETAKRNGLIPFYYLSYLFEQLLQIKGRDPALLEELLPWSKTLPENCYCKVKS
jgi:transposase